jgi:hypothetical protein
VRAHPSPFFTQAKKGPNMSRLDILQPRKGGDGKTYWTKLGSAWPAKQGGGYSLTFEALPLQALNDKGELECRVLLREPLPKDGDRAAPSRGAPSRGGYSNAAPFDDDDGSVPF